MEQKKKYRVVFNYRGNIYYSSIIELIEEAKLEMLGEINLASSERSDNFYITMEDGICFFPKKVLEECIIKLEELPEEEV